MLQSLQLESVAIHQENREMSMKLINKVGMENQNSNHMATNAKQRKVKGDIKANKNDRNLSKTNKKPMKRSITA